MELTMIMKFEDLIELYLQVPNFIATFCGREKITF